MGGEWEAEWYWDRLRSSSHVAENPFGDEVREAEHVFLGIEPHGQFPLLLSEEILQGHVYITGRSGTTVVIKDAPQLEVVAVNSIGETIDATPAPVGDELFIRGEEHLFCIAE